MSNYAKADKTTQWFQDDYPGSDLELSGDTTVVVLHTTEGSSWPSYGGGSSAPHYTYLPSMRGGEGKWRAHFPDEKSSRALRNLSGGVETNTLNSIQVELIGTCDPRHKDSWAGVGKAGEDYVFWPAATQAQLHEVAEFLADMHRRHGLRLHAPKRFLPYPSSYGSSEVRMSLAEWRNARGVVGHQHVPENTHGDPGAIDISSILDVARQLVAPPEPTREISVGHISLRTFDSDAERRQDINKVFARADAKKLKWITGTEAGAEDTRDMLRAAGEKYGYAVRFGTKNDSWIAVRKTFAVGPIESDYLPVIEDPRHRGVLSASFDTLDIGRVTVIACHYVRFGRPDAQNPDYEVNLEENEALAEAIGNVARRGSEGTGIVFYGGDQNINDRIADTFFGVGLESTMDELARWHNTGHGPIDVIASYAADKRVTALATKVYNDERFPLHGDHFYVEATFTVKLLRGVQ